MFAEPALDFRVKRFGKVGRYVIGAAEGDLPIVLHGVLDRRDGRDSLPRRPRHEDNHDDEQIAEPKPKMTKTNVHAWGEDEIMLGKSRHQAKVRMRIFR